MDDATEPTTLTSRRPRTAGRRAISKDRHTPPGLLLSGSLRTHVPFGKPRDSRAESSETPSTAWPRASIEPPLASASWCRA